MKTGVVRISFIKGPEVRYLAHLDLMRSFERALRRSGLPVTYTQGFNPHPMMVFGMPLSVSATSNMELVDLEMDSKQDEVLLLDVLNLQLPTGLHAFGAEWLPAGAKNVMASVNKAIYEIEVYFEKEICNNEISKIIEKFMNEDHIYITKRKAGKSEQEVDIRHQIFNMELLPEQKSNLTIRVMVAAGNTSNLRPELLISALEEFAEIPLKLLAIHRTRLFTD